MIEVSGLAGKTLMPRDIAQIGRPTWQNYELTKMVATALAESAGSLGAWHDNYSGMKLLSRDCGLMQINIPASEIGSDDEDDLRTESTNPEIYAPVAHMNVARAEILYNAEWNRHGVADKRYWQPWVAYTTGWATFPYPWIWHQVDGEPVGPWVPTGRYIHRAIAGQVNNKIVNEHAWQPADALHYAQTSYAPHFGLNPDMFYITSQNVVSFHVPPKPSDPPANGIGPRPTPNDGV